MNNTISSPWRADYESLNLPIFFHPWWLDVVCQKGNWEVCITKNKNGEISGVLPYYLASFLGFKVIRTPPFTPYLGVWLNFPNTQKKRTRKYGFETQVIGELIDQLPKVAWYHQIHPDQLENWLPFYWRGFRQTTRYTYVFEKLEKEEIFSEMKDKTRNMIRKAEVGSVRVEKENNLPAFLKVCSSTFIHQKLVSPFDSMLFKQLHQEIQVRNQGSIFLAKDDDDNVHAGLYLIWDAQTAYCWVLGTETKFRSSGAVQLLIWHTIQEAVKSGKRYNFEGSMLPHVEPVFRAFGAERKPVFQIYKGANRLIEALSIFLNKW